MSGSYPWLVNSQLTYERLQRLQAITAALAHGYTRRQIGAIVMRDGLGLLGGKAANLSHVQPDGTLRLFAFAGYRDGALLRPMRSMPLTERTPNTDAARAKRPIFLGSRAEIERWYAPLGPLARSLDDHAWAALPMIYDNVALGTMGLSFAEPRSFDADERNFLLAVARQCAQALARARELTQRTLEPMTREQLLALRAALRRRLGE